MKNCLKRSWSFFLSICMTFSAFSISLPPAPASVDVLIIGAGLAGLSTAYRLQKLGISYRILEASPHIGGRIRTATYPNGLQGEVGLEEFWEDNPTLEIIRELQIPTEKFVTVFSSFVHKGKVIPFLQKTNLEFLQSVFSTTEWAAYQKWDRKMQDLYAQTQTRPISAPLLELQKISFGEWVRKEPGLTETIHELVRIQSEPEYGTSWDQISALEGIVEWHIFFGKGQNCYHTIGGNQHVAEKIADKVGLSHIHFNEKVTHIRNNAAEVEIRTTNASTYKEQIYRGKYVVSTIPIYLLSEIQFEPALRETQKQAIHTQTWGAYFTAHVTLDASARKYWTINGKNILPIRAEGSLGQIYDGFSLPGTASKEVLLNLLVVGNGAEAFNIRIRSADQLREEVKKELEKLWPGVSPFIRNFEFYRYHPRAIASWPVGRSRFDELSESLRKPFGRVYFAGDFTEGTHSTGAAQSAIRVVRDISSHIGLVSKVGPAVQGAL